MDDTFARSCAHWSADKRAGMEDFYALASLDYRELASAVDWSSWLREREAAAVERGGGRLRLLDVACGSGKFPAALIRNGAIAEAGLGPIDYALLDPSAFSIAEARAALAPPFVPGAEFETTLQALDVAAGAFDVAWATHALYAIPEAEIDAALERFLGAFADAGFIAHARADAHYLQFYEHYLRGFRGGEGAPYVSAERIEEGLRRLGARVEARVIAYENRAEETDRGRVEGYLQRCVFDDGVTLEDMLANAETGPYLEARRERGAWRFPQNVSLMFVAAG